MCFLKLGVLSSSQFRSVKAWWIFPQLHRIKGVEKTWMIFKEKNKPVSYLVFPINFPLAGFASF